jgi:hypothetical protein
MPEVRDCRENFSSLFCQDKISLGFAEVHQLNDAREDYGKKFSDVFFWPHEARKPLTEYRCPVNLNFISTKKGGMALKAAAILVHRSKLLVPLMAGMGGVDIA